MHTAIHCLLPGAQNARGLTVVIDVFRAFSLAPYAIAAGVETIHPVADLDEAYALKRDNPDWLLAGERDYVKQPGFDFGNSPTEIEAAGPEVLTGRTLVHTTSAGTQGLAAAFANPEVSEVLTGSFVNASAIAEHIRARAPERVTLVAMGAAGKERTPEDDLCGMYIKNLLEDFPNDFQALKKYLATIDSARKFFDPAADYAPEKDFELCTSLDRFGFVLTVVRDAHGRMALKKLMPGEAV